MKQDAFQELVWRLEEILINRDRWSKRIGNCGGQCDGYDGPEDEFSQAGSFTCCRFSVMTINSRGCSVILIKDIIHEKYLLFP